MIIAKHINNAKNIIYLIAFMYFASISRHITCIPFVSRYKGIIFDFNRTLYNPETNNLTPGVIDLLASLKNSGYRLCLISKATTENRREEISDLGLDPYFVYIQVNEGNKNASHFRNCMDILECNPEDILVIGDRIKGEIYLANQLGMKTIWYKSGKFSTELPSNEKEKPNHTITILSDVLKYL
ncbi:MAG: HAD hydrolase-like protein [Candidatus Aenigmarchaeota archaeon]|nr:HAD hydrolase-like protein [Candidatus Aenigmarchaeota archaeon]